MLHPLCVCVCVYVFIAFYAVVLRLLHCEKKKNQKKYDDEMWDVSFQFVALRI